MTVIARGKIRLAALNGDAIPLGLALDAEGNPTTDAQKAFEGVCLPFGGVKGSVLATLMELMAGALTGSNYAGEVKSLYFDQSGPQNVGHLFFVIRPDLFMSMDEFLGRMDHFVETVRALPRMPGVDEILIPGEPEQRNEDRRRITGIPLSAKVVEELGLESGLADIPPPTGSPDPLAKAG
jgi:LDH2 family malate/lactate/ureidoglycolate dehydrogenase